MRRDMKRREALIGLAAGAGLLAAGETALAQSGPYKESPALAELVKAGKLPPVEQRLPEKPLVVPVVEKVGEYGGVWRRAFLGPADANNYIRVVYDGLFRFSPDGAKIEPKIAESAEPSADFKTWTIKLRKGSKWSDGQPFTADDILFWYNDVLLNKELTPSLPGWIKNPDGSAAKVEKVDDTTVRFTYAAPATLFLTAVANQDGADRTFAMYLPAHYLKKFHPAHAAKVNRQGRRRRPGFKSWIELFANRERPARKTPNARPWRPGRRRRGRAIRCSRCGATPTMSASTRPATSCLISTRCASPTSPTRRRSTSRPSPATSTCRNATCNMTNYPVLKDQEKTGKYRVIAWPTFGGADAVIAINQTYKADPEMGKVMAKKDFRVALSLAINRDQIKESVFLGLGEARQGVPAPWHPYFPGAEYAGVNSGPAPGRRWSAEFYRWVLGSRASRTPSPTRLKTTTVTASKMPGRKKNMGSALV